MAKEKGFYKEVGLDVEIREFNNSINVVDEVTSKKAMYGIGRSSLLIDKSNGANIKLLFSSFQSSPSVLLATKKSGINNIKDFVGKKAMMTGSASNAVSFYAMINQEGVSLDDIEIINPSFNIDDLINGKTDLMASYISNEPFLLNEKKIAYTVFDPKNYGFDFYNDILFTSECEIKNNKQRAINFKNASLKGWQYAFDHIDESVEVILNKYNTQNKSKKALVYEAKELKKLAYYKTDKLGNISKEKMQKIYNAYSVLGVIKTKIDLDELIFKEKADKVILNKKEKEWIDKHPVVKFSETDWKPLFSFKDDKQEGIIADYLNLISQKTNIKFRYIASNSWQNVLDKFKKREIDILPGNKYLLFNKDIGLLSNVYKTYPMVIITNSKYNYIDNLSRLNHKTVAIPIGFTSFNFVKKNYPYIKILPTKDIKQALLFVESGKADAFIGHIATSLYKISKLHLNDLKVSGICKFQFEHVFLVHKENKILLNIINKALKSITFEEKAKIDAKWIKVKMEQKSNYFLSWKTIIVFIIIISFLLYRSKKLKDFNIAILKKDKELKQLNKELQKNIDFVTVHLKKAQEISKIGTWEYKISEDKLIWSDEFFNILKIDKNKHPISSMKDFEKTIHPNDLKKVQKKYEEHLKNNSPYFIVHRAITHDNKIIYLEEKCETTFDEEGNPLVSIGTAQDVTQRQLSQIELRKKDKLIIQQSRLAQMGEILSMIAHQWRQPLSAISATTSNLKLKIMLDEVDIKMFEKEISLIDNYTQHLSKTIDDFRGFLSEKSIKETITLEEIIVSTLMIVEKSFESKNIALNTNFTCNQKIYTYVSKIKQVLLNLLKNAEDALLQNKVKNPKISIDTISKDKCKIITIKDNGGGIPSNIKDRVFEPYFSTKKKKNGTGLGLYMSKIIIEEHCDGKLYFQSNKNGTTFFIELYEEDN